MKGKGAGGGEGETSPPFFFHHQKTKKRTEQKNDKIQKPTKPNETPPLKKEIKSPYACMHARTHHHANLHSSNCPTIQLSRLTRPTRTIPHRLTPPIQPSARSSVRARTAIAHRRPSARKLGKKKKKSKAGEQREDSSRWDWDWERGGGRLHFCPGGLMEREGGGQEKEGEGRQKREREGKKGNLGDLGNLNLYVMSGEKGVSSIQYILLPFIYI